MNLDQFTVWLLQQKDPSKTILLADSYMRHYHKIGKSTFVLPTEHNVIEPLIESFAEDHRGFVEYIKGVREQLQDDDRKTAVHDVYRTMLVRQAQQDRRKRIDEALAVYESRRPKMQYDDRVNYVKRLEQLWGRDRYKYMDMNRGHKTRLTTDERAETLARYWDEVDSRIQKGEYIDV